MPLRDFDTPTQTAPVHEVQADKGLTWVELDCPNCHNRSYVPGRVRRLNRTGSRREYAACAWCGVQLTSGRVVKFPVPWSFRRLWPVRRRAHTFTRNGGAP